MSVISDRIKAEMTKQKMSYRDLEKATGISRSTLHRYAEKDSGKIPISKMDLISKALHTTTEYLMGWDEEENSPTELSAEESALLELFRSLPKDKQTLALEMIRIALSTK